MVKQHLDLQRSVCHQLWTNLFVLGRSEFLEQASRECKDSRIIKSFPTVFRSFYKQKQSYCVFALGACISLASCKEKHDPEKKSPRQRIWSNAEDRQFWP